MANEKEKADFRRRVGTWATKLGIAVTSCTIRPMARKWASFSTGGRLTVDTAVPRLPRALQDYVIVHELLHASVPNHGRLWKALMWAHLGDYETLERRLAKRLG